MKNTLFTYVTVPKSLLSYEWLLDGKHISDRKEKDWKKGQSIDVVLRLHIENIEKFETECFHPEAEIGFNCSYASYPKDFGTSLQGLIGSCPFEKGKTDYELAGTIDGNEISGKLFLRFSVYLNKEIKAGEENIFASQKGSTLFEDEEFVYLEGSQALFPVKAIDFAEQPFGMASNALYYLQRSFADLDANFNTAYTLYFNKNHPVYKQINSGILEEEKPDPSAQYLLKIIMYDVYKTIVTDALSKNNSLSNESLLKEFDENTVLTVEAVYTSILKDLIENILHGESIDSLKEIMSENSWGNELKRNKLFTAIQEYIFKGDLDV